MKKVVMPKAKKKVMASEERKFFYITDIDWDVDDEDDLRFLPDHDEVPVSEILRGEDIEDLDDLELDEMLSDYLSDEHGYLVNGFSYEIKE